MIPINFKWKIQSDEKADHVLHKINDEMKDIIIWLRANKLSLNISKPIVHCFLRKSETTEYYSWNQWANNSV